MPKVFVDCGFYAGVAIEQYLKKGLINKNWQIYAFEPSPDVDVEAEVGRIGLPIKISRSAVWVENGEVLFQVSTRHNASSITGTTGNQGAKQIKVSCIDFSEFISQLPRVDICSMDIEGSEFAVLEKLLADGVASKIKLLDIEFHHRFMNDLEPKDAKRLIRKLRSEGVKVKLKEALE